MVKNEPRIDDAAEKDLTYRLGMVELIGVLGFELHPADVQRAHDRAVAKPDSRVVDVAVERKAIPCLGFPLHPLGSTGPLHHTRLLRANSCCSPSACSCALGGSG